MNHDRLHTLLRRWRETGDVADEVRYLRCRLRMAGVEVEGSDRDPVIDFVRLYMACHDGSRARMWIEHGIGHCLDDDLRARLAPLPSQIRCGEAYLGGWAGHQPDLFPAAAVTLISKYDSHRYGFPAAEDRLLRLLRLMHAPDANLARLWLNTLVLKTRGARPLLESLVASRPLVRRTDLLEQLDRLIAQLEEGVPQSEALDACPVLFPERLLWALREGRFWNFDLVDPGLREGWLVPSDPGTTPPLRVEVGRALHLLAAFLPGPDDGQTAEAAAQVITCWMARADVRTALETAARVLGEGGPLHVALVQYPECFPALVVDLVRVVEEQGEQLKPLLHRLAGLVEDGTLLVGPE